MSSNSIPRVVITGMGALTALGLDVATTWEGLVAGRSGVATITQFDPSRLTTRIGAEVKGFRFPPPSWTARSSGATTATSSSRSWRLVRRWTRRAPGSTGGRRGGTDRGRDRDRHRRHPDPGRPDPADGRARALPHVALPDPDGLLETWRRASRRSRSARRVRTSASSPPAPPAATRSARPGRSSGAATPM